MLLSLQFHQQRQVRRHFPLILHSNCQQSREFYQQIYQMLACIRESQNWLFCQSQWSRSELSSQTSCSEYLLPVIAEHDINVCSRKPTMLICISFVLLGLGLPASCVKWKIKLSYVSLASGERHNSVEESHLGSTLPLLVAPGSPARGVRPILVSKDSPFFTAQAEAPLPRCSAIMLVWVGSFSRYLATERVMNA
jgi:hypothetical protein